MHILKSTNSNYSKYTPSSLSLSVCVCVCVCVCVWSMGRAPCCEKVGLKKGSWTAEEDEKLLNYITAHGEGSWKSLPKNAGLLRCGKSCRLRWINYLRADLKRGNITREEEQVIIKMHTTLGNRWSVIAGHLPGRTDNEIKNYWNSHLSRRIHRFRKIGSENEIVTMVLDKVPGRGKGRGGRTSPSAMEKNSAATDAKEKDIKQKGNHDRCSTEEEESDLTLGNPHQRSTTPSVTTTFDDLDQDVWPGEALGSIPPLMSPDWGMWGPADDLFCASYEDIVACGALDLKDCWPGGGPQKEEEVGFCSSSSCEQVENLFDWDMEAQLWGEEREMCSWLWYTADK